MKNSKKLFSFSVCAFVLGISQFSFASHLQVVPPVGQRPLDFYERMTPEQKKDLTEVERADWMTMLRKSNREYMENLPKSEDPLFQTPQYHVLEGKAAWGHPYVRLVKEMYEKYAPSMQGHTAVAKAEQRLGSTELWEMIHDGKFTKNDSSGLSLQIVLVLLYIDAQNDGNKLDSWIQLYRTVKAGLDRDVVEHDALSEAVYKTTTEQHLKDLKDDEPRLQEAARRESIRQSEAHLRQPGCGQQIQ